MEVITALVFGILGVVILMSGANNRDVQLARVIKSRSDKNFK